MWEQGRVSIPDDGERGRIRADTGVTPVRYERDVVVGRAPKKHDVVCFQRDERNPGVALRVRSGTCAAVTLALQLETTFRNHLGDAQLADDGLQEVLRISRDRAVRILRPLPLNDSVGPDAVVITARLALATAAMELMATETASIVKGEITAKSLRDVLRGQRPRLPR